MKEGQDVSNPDDVGENVVGQSEHCQSNSPPPSVYTSTDLVPLSSSKEQQIEPKKEGEDAKDSFALCSDKPQQQQVEERME